MSMTMEDEIKRWTAKRKAALVMEIIQGKTRIAEASRSFDLTHSKARHRPALSLQTGSGSTTTGAPIRLWG
jgi:transposase-like protein